MKTLQRILCTSAAVMIFPVLFLLPAAALAATYYVDGMAGSDGNSGLTSAAPWKTIAKVNSAQFAPGDQILLKRGSVWQESLSVPSSGTSASPLVFDAYGSGANPVLIGADRVTGFSPSGSAYAASGISTKPNVVFYNGQQLKLRSGAGSSVGRGEWDWSSGTLYVNVGAAPSQGELLAGQRNNTATIYGKKYVTIRNLELRYGNLRGVYVGNSSNCTIELCTIVRPYLYGILNEDGDGFVARKNTIVGGTKGVFYADTGIGSTRPATIDANDVSFFEIGIQLLGAMSGGTISANHVHDIDTVDAYDSTDCQGIELTGVDAANQARGITVVGNLVHDCAGSGIATWNAGSSRIAYNIVYNASRMKDEGGIALWVNSAGNIVHNNTVVDSRVYGIVVANSCNSNIVKNNIIVRTIGSGLVVASTTSGNVTGYNNIYKSSVQDWRGPTTSPGPNTISVDPLFTDEAAKNFTLRSTSPCLTAGENLGSTYGKALNATSTWVNSVTFSDQTSSKWVMGAFKKTVVAPSGLRLSP